MFTYLSGASLQQQSMSTTDTCSNDADAVVEETGEVSPLNRSNADPPIQLSLSSTTSLLGHEIPLVLEMHCRQTLCFSVSEIAAMVGFHPFRVLPHLLLRLVYQGK